MAETTGTYFSALHRQQFANLFTFRKSGDAVKTPVWFAEHDGKLYVMTVEDSGKVKRIRNNDRVQIGPSDQRGNPLGPTVEARARLGQGPITPSGRLDDQKYRLVVEGPPNWTNFHEFWQMFSDERAVCAAQR